MVKHVHAKLMLLMLLLILGVTSGFAQGGKVTGKVTDATDGQTLPGVTILVKGTTNGTTTDISGSYSIVVDPNAILVFSYIGYETQEITVQPNTTVNVVLKIKSTGLNEFVVIGYGVQKKSDATGSVSVIGSKDFNKGSITTPTSLITGKIAGVQVTTGGGAPGSGATIRIRNGSSLSASNDPLYVIDDVPIDNQGIDGMRNPLNTINPSDIENITILKDASATAIYGSRASNGVVLITTKKGSIGKDKNAKSIHLEYNGNFSMFTVPKRINVLGSDEFKSLINERYAGNNSVLNLLGNSSTDWQDEIYQNALGMDHYLSASGAYKFLPYRISLGYTREDGILKTDNLKRTTLSAALNPTFFDNHLKVNVNVKYMNIKNRFADNGAIGGAIQYDPTKPVNSDSTYTVHFNDANGNPDSLITNFGGYYAWIQPTGVPVEQGSANPVALLNMKEDKSTADRIIGNVQLDYKFHFLPELRANLNLGFDQSTSDGTVYVPNYAPWVFNAVKGGGTDRVYNQYKKNQLLDFYLNYVKVVDPIKSKFDVEVGYSWQHFLRSGKSYETNIPYHPEIDSNYIVATDTHYGTQSFPCIILWQVQLFFIRQVSAYLYAP